MYYQMSDEDPLMGEYDDFIGSYSSIVDSDYCKEIMKEFDYFHDLGATFCGDRQFPEGLAGRFDYALDLNYMGNVTMGTDYSEILNAKLRDCFEEYRKVYPTLRRRSYFSTSQKVSFASKAQYTAMKGTGQPREGIFSQYTFCFLT